MSQHPTVPYKAKYMVNIDETNHSQRTALIKFKVSVFDHVIACVWVKHVPVAKSMVLARTLSIPQSG